MCSVWCDTCCVLWCSPRCWLIRCVWLLCHAKYPVMLCNVLFWCICCHSIWYQVTRLDVVYAVKMHKQAQRFPILLTHLLIRSEDLTVREIGEYLVSGKWVMMNGSRRTMAALYCYSLWVVSTQQPETQIKHTYRGDRCHERNNLI